MKDYEVEVTTDPVTEEDRAQRRIPAVYIVVRRKKWAGPAMTSEQRSASAARREAEKTPEQRSARALRGWITRRRNLGLLQLGDVTK